MHVEAVAVGGEIYVIFGHSCTSAVTKIYRYNRGTDTWTEMPALPVQISNRYRAAATETTIYLVASERCDQAGDEVATSRLTLRLKRGASGRPSGKGKWG